MDLWLIPIISAFVGWSTNVLAVKLLFWPLKERKIMGLKIQGIIPRRRKAIEKKVAEIVEDNFLKTKDIRETILNKDFEETLIEKVKTTLKKAVTSKVPSFMERTVNNIIENYVNNNKELIIKELISSVEESISNVNIKEIIIKNLEKIETPKLNEIIFKVLKKEFKFIELLGGLIGFAVGLLQLAIAKW